MSQNDSSNLNDLRDIKSVESGAYSQLDLREVWMVLRRNSRIIGGMLIFSLCLAITFLLIATPQYTAESILQVNIQKNNVVDIEAVVSGITADESQIQSQLDIITSRSLAGRVVDVLNLVNDPEFSPKVDKGSFIRWLAGLIKSEENIEPDEQVNDREKLETRSVTVSNVLKRLQVARNPRSYTIIVKFATKSPQKSALIANTVVDEYIKGQLAVKFDATQRANTWLSAKLTELQRQVRESEELVQAFREKHGLIETAGRTITDQQLSELNTQLILAQTERAQTEARLNGIGNADASMDVLSSKVIQDLSNQETEVRRKRSDLSSQYGPKHPKIINVNSEMAEIRAKMAIEVQKVKYSLENEVNVAKAREESLKKSLDELQDKSGLSKKAKIELDELDRQKNANKSLYESFLGRSKETTENQGLDVPDALIISKAEEPLNPSFPLIFLTLIMALLVGGAIGVVMVFILEHLDNAVSSSTQVEKITGHSVIGMIPELGKNTSILNYLIKRPSSVFAESLRSVLTAVHFSNPDKVPKVIMITSSVPREGKSSFALTLASLAANAGKKVLLIDGDLKRPAIAKSLKVEVEFGLSDLLAGTANESQVIRHEEKTGMHFIPALPNTVNSHNLLGSGRMKELLEKMREQYDMIIIDTPPVMAISDCIVLTGIVDTTLFVVRWQKTPRELVKAAVKQLKAFNVTIAGVVLTRVDMEKQSKYSYGDKGHYYKNYSEYYS